MIRHNCSEPVRPSRVVILGSKGFVGRNLVDHLGRLEIETLPVSSTEVDLCSQESASRLLDLVRDGDAVVLTSAITPDKGRNIATLMKNLKMGEHFAAILEKAPVSHVVYISSDAVYSDDANPVRETSCRQPGTLHGLMHLAREQMFAYTLRERKIPFLFLRLCAVYGPGDPHQSYGPNRFVRSAVKERKITLFGNGEEKRDHVFIQDVVNLAGMCLMHRSDGTLNIATGSSIFFGYLAQKVVNFCPFDVRIDRLARSTPVTHRSFDITTLVRAFPSFQFMPIEDGLLESLQQIDKDGPSISWKRE